MLVGVDNSGLTKTTSCKVVLPFYGYAAISFLIATVLLLFTAPAFTQHYFHPHTLAITHIMALGWGTMIILGASHQLVPVLIEGKLYSNFLAQISFACASIGIPLLVYGFYVFNFRWPAQWGGSLVVAAVIIYLINLALSISKSKQKNVHAVFVFTAATWLLVTTSVGLILVFNFTFSFLPKDSLEYLALHAHLGIVGWFLLLIFGVGSRLIPMFLISKYANVSLLWWIYGLLNGGLLFFVLSFLCGSKMFFGIPFAAIAMSVLVFVYYCRQAYRERIRKKVDVQMRVSLLSVVMMMIPVIMLLVIIVVLLASSTPDASLVLTYGFVIFFGWITAIIFGMTFKTLPFIVWNKVYHLRSGMGKTPNPKDLLNDDIFRLMSAVYLAGFVLFSMGILLKILILLQSAAVLLLLAAVLYNWNVMKVLMHKPVSVCM